ncbi:MAG: type IV pilus twitching motility protein PilT [Elusimicrobia bacterium]|nr:type IV pilus twitching motility protein PilT [Candidatus Liberimonas magnetica]
MENYRSHILAILRNMVDNNASDLHLTAKVPPYMRINGSLKDSDFPALGVEENENLIFSILKPEDKNEFLKTKTIDFSLTEESLGIFRINVYQQRGTIAAAIRRFPFKIPAMEELGLPVGPIKNYLNYSNGLVLVCGPTGSGKTTTLASMVDYINRSRNCHIISIEDPIEYVHKNIKSLIHQREVRRDTPNFKDALKYVLREDPDIVIVGEMRDLETIASAITIAETGHLVFATLHTGDSSESIRRIIDVFPSTQQAQIVAQLAYTLRGVINQTLIQSVGYAGRVLATEVMIVTPAIQNLIRENKTEQIYSQIQTSTNIGMHTMNQSLCELVRKNKIAKDVALGKTKRVSELLKLLENYNA